MQKKLTPRCIKPAVFLQQDIKYVHINEVPIYLKRGFKMAEKPKNSKERVWTGTELKYLALVLADAKTQFAVRLDTLALKKSLNSEVFEDISKAFESCLSSNLYPCLFLTSVSRDLYTCTINTGRTIRRTNCEYYSSSRICTRPINY